MVRKPNRTRTKRAITVPMTNIRLATDPRNMRLAVLKRQKSAIVVSDLVHVNTFNPNGSKA